ncbi:unnamed protein product [Ilex paraguariensis]|uniref:Uncharacterized protein n=1 Tax=Ilex paraguariensis TaxID=185542 RepID=A0ABC8S8S6_9AQUA
MCHDRVSMGVYTLIFLTPLKILLSLSLSPLCVCIYRYPPSLFICIVAIKKYTEKRERVQSMAAVVDVWMGGLAKLTEKVQARKPLFFRAKRREAIGEQEENKGTKEESSSSSSSVMQKSVAAEKKENSMSEATVFLLMDRFAPC